MQILSLLSDILLLGATAGIALWCRLLARRLRAFNDLDSGLGGTIAALARQVDDLRSTIVDATRETEDGTARLEAALERADDRIGRMEMLLASLETLEEDAADRLLHDTHPSIHPSQPEETQPSFRASRGHMPGQTGRIA